MSDWDDGWGKISWDGINELKERLDKLEGWAHPPIGQDQIYDRLEKLEKQVQDLNARTKNFIRVR